VRRFPVKNATVLALGLGLTLLGAYNVYLKTTWTLMEDGVHWERAPQGLVAARVAEGGPAERAGIREGDVLLGVANEPVLEVAQIQAVLAHCSPGESISYSLLRANERRSLAVQVQPLPRGNLTLFYYLSLAGFCSLVVGTIVALKRRPDRTLFHFYAICILFFLVYSLSYAGKLDLVDWAILWLDQVAILLLPVVYLHFCLWFPTRHLSRSGSRWVPAAYFPALFLVGAAIASPLLFVAVPDGDVLWQVTTTIERWQPLYFASLFVAAFAVLARSYRATRNMRVRRQMKWLVWGTGTGVLPFLGFYAIPFALGREPRLPMQLAGYLPLAAIPLSLAYAVVRHRLMDVELVFRRTLVSLLASAAVVGLSLLAFGLANVVAGEAEVRGTIVAVLSTLVVILLFMPVKGRIQELVERLFYRDRYSSRKALLRLSQELNADPDLGRMTDRLLDGIQAALGVDSVAVFLPERDRAFTLFRSRGTPPGAETLRLPMGGGLLSYLASGEPLDVETTPVPPPEIAPLDLTHYFPCRVKGEVIAVIGVGLKAGPEPLNSEEVDLIHALAGQAATAFMNGRLYRSLRQKADELQRLTEYNQNILESIDAGILVLDLEGQVVRWNRALEALDGRSRQDVIGKRLDEIFPAAFMEALQGSLVLGRNEEIAHIYKLHLQTSDGRGLMVNVSIAPFQEISGERWGTILILEDISARVRLEQQLQHSEKMASVGLLAAGVAHEVNTPLAGISSYTQLLRQNLHGDDPRAPLLEKIETQTFRAAKIVNNLLNFSRSDRSEFKSLELNKIILDVLSLLEHQLERSRVRVVRELAPELPGFRGNENRMQQVFFNLMLNARDAMRGGGWLTLATRLEDGSLVAEVRDTGHGIERENVRRIYDPFFTTKGIGRGTGLGLSVSYGIVQEHGGAIFVESTPGKGTRFQVSLPALAMAEVAER
jgi:PAS domain S-box-containing protein